jgi:hypothetical protein
MILWLTTLPEILPFDAKHRLQMGLVVSPVSEPVTIVLIEPTGSPRIETPQILTQPQSNSIMAMPMASGCFITSRLQIFFKASILIRPDFSILTTCFPSIGI